MRKIWLVLAALVAAGCAGTSGADDAAPTADASVFEVVDPGELAPPADDVVLELIVDGAPAEWSLADLEAVDLVRLSVHEPFIDAPTVFEGPRLGELLVTAGVEPEAEATIEVAALDGYVHSLSVEDALGSDGLLATRERGAPIPIDAGGPIRLVFSDGSDLDAERRLDAWVWSIVRIEVG